MRALIAFLFLASFAAAEGEVDWTKLLPPSATIAERVEKFSGEGRYGEIYDLLSGRYQQLVRRDHFVRRSEELKWILTDAKSGVFTTHSGGKSGDAALSGKVMIGRYAHHIDAVTFFVNEDGAWRMWNFPFLYKEFPDRPDWPPPL